MRHRYLLFVSAALAFVPLLTDTQAQDHATQSVPRSAEQACDEFGRPPGHPTLKRRVTSENPTSGTDNQEKGHGQCKNTADIADPGVVSFRFVRLTALHETDVMKFFREKRVGLRRDRMPDKETVDKAAEVLKQLLSSKGHVYAIVSAFRDEELNSITFQVIEGERFPLAEIRFEGLRVFSSDKLSAITRQCLSNDQPSDSDYDQEALEYCLRSASNFIMSAGYLQARFGEPKIEIAGNKLVATVKVEEGSLYRLGQLKIEGSNRFSTDQIRAMLLVNEGEIIGADKISKWLFEDLRKAYSALGYIEYTAEPVPEFKEREGIVDFKVTIEEGAQFRVQSLKLEGDQLPTDQLLNYSTLKAGDIYDANAFEAFVNKLNQSEFFEPIDKDKDSDFRTNKEERLVSITLKIRRRS